MEFNLIAYIAVALIIAVAVTIDMRTRRIPNWLTVPAFALGLVFHIATGGWSGLLFSLGGFAVGFGVLLVLWLTGGGGGGDVKLMGAVGAWIGALPTLIVFIGSALFAMICTITVIVMSRKHPRAFVSASVRAGATPSATVPAIKQTIPYALPVAMSFASLFVYFVFTA